MPTLTPAQWLFSWCSWLEVQVVRLLFGWRVPAAPPGAVGHAGPARVLVVKLDGIGDFILTTPWLRALRASLPQARITLVVNADVLGLAQGCPWVDAVLPLELEPDPLLRHGRMPWRMWRLARKAFRQAPPDLAVVPRVDADESFGAILAYFSRARIRLGFTEDSAPKRRWYNRGFDALLTHGVHGEIEEHTVLTPFRLRQVLAPDAEPGALELWLPAPERAWARSLVAGLRGGNGAGPVVALAPGAGAPSRRWPPERYREVAAHLARTWAARIILLGGPAERAMGGAFPEADGLRVTDLLGRTTLTGTAAVLEQCDLFLGGDSGCMHLAAAAGIPVVVVSPHPEHGSRSHANAPGRFGPWGVPFRVLRPRRPLPPCVESCGAHNPHCINQVRPAQVCRAADALLAMRNCPVRGARPPGSRHPR